MFTFSINFSMPAAHAPAEFEYLIVDSKNGKKFGSIRICGQNESEGGDDISFIQSLDFDSSNQKNSSTTRESGEALNEESVKKMPKLEGSKFRAPESRVRDEQNRSPIVTRRRKTGYTAVVPPLELVEENVDVDCVSISSKSFESETESPEQSELEKSSLGPEASCSEAVESESDAVSSRRSVTPPIRTPKRKSGYPMVQQVISSSSTCESLSSRENICSNEFENLTKEFNKLCGVRRRSSASVELVMYNFETERKKFRCRSCDFNSSTEAEMKRHVSKSHRWDHLSAKRRKSICKKIVQKSSISAKTSVNRKKSELPRT